MGFCYEHGRGVDENEAEAVRYFQAAAAQGHVIAKESFKELTGTSFDDYINRQVGIAKKLTESGLFPKVHEDHLNTLELYPDEAKSIGCVIS